MTLAAVPTELGVTWHDVCSLKSLPRERGAAVVVAGVQIALFRLEADHVYAVQQLDPFSGATVMSRCVVGRVGDVPTISSPMYGQAYDLRTGTCLHPVGRVRHSLQTYPVHIQDAVVTVGLPGTPSDDHLRRHPR